MSKISLTIILIVNFLNVVYTHNLLTVNIKKDEHLELKYILNSLEELFLQHDILISLQEKPTIYKPSLILHKISHQTSLEGEGGGRRELISIVNENSPEVILHEHAIYSHFTSKLGFPETLMFDSPEYHSKRALKMRNKGKMIVAVFPTSLDSKDLFEEIQKFKNKMNEYKDKYLLVWLKSSNKNKEFLMHINHLEEDNNKVKYYKLDKK